MANVKGNAQINGGALAFDLALAFAWIRMSEIGREAEQRRNLPGRLEDLTHRRDTHLEEAIVVFDPFRAERGGLAQPREVVHPAGEQLIEIALGKNADSRGSAAVGHGRLGDSVMRSRGAMRALNGELDYNFRTRMLRSHSGRP